MTGSPAAGRGAAGSRAVRLQEGQARTVPRVGAAVRLVPAVRLVAAGHRVAAHRAAGLRDRGLPMTGLDMTRRATIGRTTIGSATSGDRIRAASAAITANPANGRGGHLVRTTRPDRPVAKGRRARTAAHLVRTTRLDRHVAKGRRARTAAHPALRAVIALEARDRRTPAIDTRIGTRIRNEVATHSDARRMGVIAIRTAGRPAT